MRILVANRGEIAVRLIQGILETGHEPIALHTKDDTLHTTLAHRSIELPRAASYVDADLIVTLAKENGCEAVLPGYGFLSESAAFAQLCKTSGIIFAGPSPEVLASLGDKASAKKIAQKLGVFCLPSSPCIQADDVRRFVKKHGFPVMIKALDGGGGKGIRIIRQDKEIEELYLEAILESPSQKVFVEKAALEGFKHIEVQILGDQHGNVIHLHERECSLQRRFQKVIEIAPSSLPRRRVQPLFDAALKMARSVQYAGLGTFEFLASATNDEYYFMECNPRLQVEHTITEQITGLDLVQLLIATTIGKANLRTLRMDVAVRGVSIQCRINAEDPTTYTPSVGTISSLRLPAGSGIRVDSIVSHSQSDRPYSASDQFDSLLGKVILTASTYEQTLKRAIYAISCLHVHGVTTNQSLIMGLLLSDLLKHPKFIDITSLNAPQIVKALVSAGQSFLSSLPKQVGSTATATSGGTSAPPALSIPSTFRKGETYTISLSSQDAPFDVHIDAIRKNNFPQHLAADVSISGRPSERLTFEKSSVTMNGKTASRADLRRGDPLDAGDVVVPFAGVLVEILVELGESVEKDDTVAVFRQGKMELDVRASRRGRVTYVAPVKEGESVPGGTCVVVVEEERQSKL